MAIIRVRHPGMAGFVTGNRLFNKKRLIVTQYADLVDKMRLTAVALTSGTVSLRQMRIMNHPYARRREKFRRALLRTERARGSTQTRQVMLGFGFLPKLPIHKQTGRLQRSMRLRRVDTEGNIFGGTVFWVLGWGVHYSRFVLGRGGTKFMIDRGFLPEMMRAYKRRLRLFMRQVKKL